MTPNLENFADFIKSESGSVEDLKEMLLVMSKAEFAEVLQAHVAIGLAILEVMPMRARFDGRTH